MSFNLEVLHTVTISFTALLKVTATTVTEKEVRAAMVVRVAARWENTKSILKTPTLWLFSPHSFLSDLNKLIPFYLTEMALCCR